MKLPHVFVLFCVIGSAKLVSQNTESSTVLTNAKEIGKINDITVSLLKSLDIQTSVNRSKVRLAYAPAKSKVADMYVEFADTTELSNLIRGLKSIEQGAGTVNENDLSDPNLSILTPKGVLVSCYLTYQKTQAVAGSGQPGTNEKVYVKTEEKFYDGKTVYSDGGGTYIWRKVTLNPENNRTRNGFVVRGKREFAIQFQPQVPYSKVIFNTFDFKQLIILLEAAQTNLNPTTN